MKMSRLRAWLYAGFVFGLTATPSLGQLGPLIYSQPPNRLFGFISDTRFEDDFGNLDSAIYADRFSISQTNVSIRQIIVYGFYGTQFQGFDPDPPAIESFRIRFHNQHGTFPPNLPPGDVLYDATLDSTDRELTGLLVFPGRREYRYTFDLAEAFTPNPGSLYWFEISQIGDPSSTWRWENSNGGEYAVQHPIDGPWQTFAPGQLAYEFRVPEPLSGLLIIGAVMMAMQRRSRHRV